MANMSYCRFQNTVMDMEDCFNAMADAVDMEEPMELSSDEQRAFQRMYDMLHSLTDMIEQVIEMEDAAAVRE